MKFCGKVFSPQAGHVRFCHAPPGHEHQHVIIFRGRALRYAITKEEENFNG